MLIGMGRLASLTLFLLIAVRVGCSQSCPNSPKFDPKLHMTLQGTLLYHEDLRQWLELHLSQPVCGETSIQLVPEQVEWRNVESWRDCNVTISGTLFEPSTGYYSADLAMDHLTISPDPTCRAHPVKPDLSKIAIPRSIKSYLITISVDYRDKGSIAVHAWKDNSRKQEFRPWEPYASYLITGSRDVIWFHCAKGFEIRGASQAPMQNHELIQEDTMWGTTLDDSGVNTITYSCKRL